MVKRCCMLGQHGLEMGRHVHLVENGFSNFTLHHHYFESPALIVSGGNNLHFRRALPSGRHS
jgi:hypothetical protein